MSAGPSRGSLGRSNTPMRELNFANEQEFVQACNVFQTNVRRHALLAWFGLPLAALLQWLVPELRPSCEDGFKNIPFVVIMGLIEGHHVYAENQAWHAFKKCLTDPETTILRQHGVLRSRKWLVLLGIAQSIAIFANWIFPVFVVSCGVAEGESYDFWLNAWSKIPVIGVVVSQGIPVVHFWGAILIITAINWFVNGLRNLIKLPEVLDFDPLKSEEKDVKADIILEWAIAAETAMMPSLQALCDATALNRRFVYRVVDFEERERLKKDAIFGKGEMSDALDAEMIEVKYEKFFNERDATNYSCGGISLIVLAKGLQIWLKTTYMMLMFDFTGVEAKIKIYGGIVVNAVVMLHQGCTFAAKRGLLGGVMAFIMVLFIVWATKKTLMSFQCPSHMWSMTKGCKED